MSASAGLLRYAAALKHSSGSQHSRLSIDAGNALFGNGSLASRGEVMAAAYELLDYDAINISYRDFRFGQKVTIDLVASRKFAAVSANLFHEATGKLLLKPYVVKQISGKRVAIVGVTQSPAGLEFLPHLKKQLAGIRIRPPAEALAEWLPKAKIASDRVILLYYGSAAGLQPLAEKFGLQLDAILVGGARPDELRADAKPPQIGTEEHGREIVVFHLDAPGTVCKSKIERIAVDASIEPDPAMEKLLDQFREKKR